MKRQIYNTTKTSFLTKFKNTKIWFKIIIIGGILTLTATTIIVPIVVANKGDSSNPKHSVGNKQDDNNEDGNKQDGNKQDDNKQDDNKQDDNKQDDNNEDGNKQDDNNEDGNKQDDNKQDDNNEDGNKQDDNQQEKTDSYVPWHIAYYFKNVTLQNATESKYDFINDQISTTKSTHPGNRAFKSPWESNITFNKMSTIGIDKNEVLKNKANDKIVGTFIKFLGYDFRTSKTFANVFYQLKEDSAKWYYETIRITGFGKPKIVPSDAATIAGEEFGNFVLPRDFNVSSDLSTIGNYAFRGAGFEKGANFSLAQTQVKSIPAFVFAFAKLPNAFALNSETNSIELNAFYEATFDKEANFSLAQTQVKTIPISAFAFAKLPNGFALNDETNLIKPNAFFRATFDKEANFSLAQTQVKTIPIQAFTNAKLPNGFVLNDETNLIEDRAFYQAYLNPRFKIPNTVTSIAQDAFQDAILPSGYAWYDKDDNKQTITTTNYPKAGWYVGKI